MQRLNLPDHGVKTMRDDAGERVWDPVRKKWLVLQPEEWVRQHVIAYLVNDLQCPLSLIGVEQGITLNGLSKRADVVVHDRAAKPLLLVECKAPEVKMDQRVLDQAARYNLVFRVPYLLVTNGLVHYCCRIDHAKAAVDFLPELPAYTAMLGEGGG